MLRWTEVSSSAVRAIGYDIARRELHVVYTGGGHYLYRRVPRRTAEALLEAPSVGEFVNLQIKPFHAYARVAPDSPPRIGNARRRRAAK